jgi:hypothetical protein
MAQDVGIYYVTERLPGKYETNERNSCCGGSRGAVRCRFFGLCGTMVATSVGNLQKSTHLTVRRTYHTTVSGGGDPALGMCTAE